MPRTFSTFAVVRYSRTGNSRSESHLHSALAFGFRLMHKIQSLTNLKMLACVPSSDNFCKEKEVSKDERMQKRQTAKCTHCIHNFPVVRRLRCVHSDGPSVDTKEMTCFGKSVSNRCNKKEVGSGRTTGQLLCSHDSKSQVGRRCVETGRVLQSHYLSSHYALCPPGADNFLLVWRLCERQMK